MFNMRTEESSAKQYFQFYGYLSQQQNMLQVRGEGQGQGQVRRRGEGGGGGKWIVFAVIETLAKGPFGEASYSNFIRTCSIFTQF